MQRYIGIDFGFKRTGIAISDPLQLIAAPFDTIETPKLFSFIDNYIKNEKVEGIVVGFPRKLDNTNTNTTEEVISLIDKLKNKYPDFKIIPVDERFTSKMALDALIQAGTTKKYRQNKGNIDKVSASIILQSFLDHKERYLRDI